MTDRVLIATGCNAGFFAYMEEAIQSLIALDLHKRADLGVLDLGLTAEQVQKLQALGCTVVVPRWTFSIPQELEITHEIGLVARTALPEYFPGYDFYLWFDADAWAQTTEFFDRMIEGARQTGAAVIRENGLKYKRDYKYMRWWFGNMVACYGLVKGLQVALRPVVNIGIMAIASKAPHWQVWIRNYEQCLRRRKRINLDQHAFNAMLDIDKLPSALSPARHNWICTLSTPWWDPVRQLLCEPTESGMPISVIHMAGPRKDRVYRLEQIGGGQIETAITYAKIRQLTGKAA